MQVINCKKQNLVKLGYNSLQEWRQDPNNIYIGRDMSFYVKGAQKSKWHNPFNAKKYGRSECLKLFKEYMMENKQLLSELHELDGKVLGCWCKPEDCHGDILIELLEKSKTEQLI